MLYSTIRTGESRYRSRRRHFLLLLRRDGNDQIASRFALDAKVTTRHFEFHPLAGREALRDRGGVVHAPRRAGKVARARRADQCDSVAGDALVRDVQVVIVEHVRRKRMAAHIEREAVRQVVKAGENLQRSVGSLGSMPHLPLWRDDHQRSGLLRWWRASHLTGRVSSSGHVSVRVSSIPQYAVGSGRLSRSRGGGGWRGQGSTGTCSGTWSASRA